MFFISPFNGVCEFDKVYWYKMSILNKKWLEMEPFDITLEMS